MFSGTLSTTSLKNKKTAWYIGIGQYCAFGKNEGRKATAPLCEFGALYGSRVRAQAPQDYNSLLNLSLERITTINNTNPCDSQLRKESQHVTRRNCTRIERSVYSSFDMPRRRQGKKRYIKQQSASKRPYPSSKAVPFCTLHRRPFFASCLSAGVCDVEGVSRVCMRSSVGYIHSEVLSTWVSILLV